MANLTLYAGANDSVLELQVMEAIGAIDLSGAAVTYDLKDAAGTSVDAGSMVYVTVTAGYYIFRATLADTLAIVVGDDYTAEINCNGGVGLNGAWSIPVAAAARTS